MQEVASNVQVSIIDQQTLYLSLFSCVINFLLLLITCLSVYYAYRAYQHQKQRAFKDTACNIAKVYVQEIIENYDDIINAFEAYGLATKIKNTIQYEYLHDFDQYEMMFVLTSQNIDYFSFEKEMSQVDDKLMKDIRMILNNLELFAMSCRYELADEKMIYKPLHDSFLSYMWLFSFYICKLNVNKGNKMFTNAIWLFNLWKERLIAIQLNPELLHEYMDDD